MIEKLQFIENEFLRGILLCIGLLFLIPANLYSEDTGYKYFKNYSYKEYDHHEQNWGIAQAENGIIYVANQGGVLIYDGVSWRTIYKDIPNKSVLSLDIDKKGTVYIGGRNEFGYLAPDTTGSLGYVSLVDHIKSDDHKNFSNVWRTYATEEGVYFRTPELILRWDSKEIKAWQVNGILRSSFLYKGNIYVQKEGVGLMRFEKNSLMLIPGGEIFADAAEEYRVFMMAPYGLEPSIQKILIGTRQKGFFLYDGVKAEPFPTEVDDYLKKNRVYHGIRLSCGEFALATRNGGLIIMDHRGNLIYAFNKSTGLQDDNIKYVFEDNLGNIWLALGNGISRLEYDSPFFHYDDLSGLPGAGQSVLKHNSDLYVGTFQGLFVLDSLSKKFRPVPNIMSSCWGLLSVDGSLLAATDEGVFQVNSKDNKIRRILKDQSFVLFSAERFPGRTWCGTLTGLVLLNRQNNRWQEERRFDKKINQEIRAITEDKNGCLWLSTIAKGFIRVDIRDNINDPVVTYYGADRGVPEGGVYAARAAGHVIFATVIGIFRFDEEKKIFTADPTLGDQFAAGPDAKPVFRLTEDKDKNIWFSSESRNFRAVPGPDNLYRIHFKPFLRLYTAQVHTIYPDPDGENIWFGNADGLVRYKSTIKKNYQQDFRTLIRKVISNDKLIYDGYKAKTNLANKELLPNIEYPDRHLFQFLFAAPYFECETEIEYRYLLEGYNEDWSNWTKEKKGVYTNIDAGLYTFRVQARNIYKNLGQEDFFQFKILLPWYRKWWAFLSYIFIFSILTYLVVNWRRSFRLEHERKRLEKIVKERTAEISEKNLQLQKQSEKLAEMDKIKSRFFANISHEFRTPLTLIMSPLEEMLADSRGEKQKERIELMLRNSHQLLVYINQLLDLSQFDSGKMKLQVSLQNFIPFLEVILDAFHVLTEKKGIELEFQPQKKDISFYFDVQKIEEVMYNLLLNAIKFTPAGGKITVSISMGQPSRESGDRSYSQDEPSPQEPGFIIISVRDTGIGMTKEQLDHVFDRFYQAKTYKDRGHKGSGIGLTLTREIINFHHGRIDVHSQEGKGTEFVVRLPMGKEHLKPGEIIESSRFSADDFIGKKPGYLLEDYIAREEEGAEIPEAGENEGEKKEAEEDTDKQEKNVILVVEDHRDMRKHISTPLEPLYTVVEACDGKEGIARAKEIIPDLIISDIMMPEADGYELCRELKQNIETSHIPIILLTAKASEDSVIQGLETGADDYITKPFNRNILHSRIKNLIELRRQFQLKIQRRKMLLPAEIKVSSMDEKFLLEFQGIIEKNLDDPEFNVDQLCKKLYMGRSTLFRKIQALTGETPNQFILSYRLERGAQLLRENFGNVTEVAMAVGFSSPPYFAKCFKEKYHKSPSAYQASELKSSADKQSS